MTVYVTHTQTLASKENNWLSVRVMVVWSLSHIILIYTPLLPISVQTHTHTDTHTQLSVTQLSSISSASVGGWAVRDPGRCTTHAGADEIWASLSLTACLSELLTAFITTAFERARNNVDYTTTRGERETIGEKKKQPGFKGWYCDFWFKQSKMMNFIIL